MGFGFINALGVVLQKNRKIFLKNENLEEEICLLQPKTEPFQKHSSIFRGHFWKVKNSTKMQFYVLRLKIKNNYDVIKKSISLLKILSVAKALFDLQKYKNFELIFVYLKEERPKCLFFENRKISKKSTLGGLDNYSSCGYTIEQHV